MLQATMEPLPGGLYDFSGFACHGRLVRKKQQHSKSSFMYSIFVLRICLAISAFHFLAGLERPHEPEYGTI